ncbi:MAG: hypothetical protein U5R48_14175 [Gammaproteobacteria bacterium]|nr:hypothetical protein [Gammaproteobacteria bacterium]
MPTVTLRDRRRELAQAACQQEQTLHCEAGGPGRGIARQRGVERDRDRDSGQPDGGADHASRGQGRETVRQAQQSFRSAGRGQDQRPAVEQCHRDDARWPVERARREGRRADGDGRARHGESDIQLQSRAEQAGEPFRRGLGGDAEAYDGAGDSAAQDPPDHPDAGMQHDHDAEVRRRQEARREPGRCQEQNGRDRAAAEQPGEVAEHSSGNGRLLPAGVRVRLARFAPVTVFRDNTRGLVVPVTSLVCHGVGPALFRQKVADVVHRDNGLGKWYGAHPWTEHPSSAPADASTNGTAGRSAGRRS